MTARAVLAADEVIELGQGPGEAPVPSTELDEIRGVIDAWNANYGRKISTLIANQSRLARGESTLAVWGRSVVAVGLPMVSEVFVPGVGAVAALPVAGAIATWDNKEEWEATRIVAVSLLNQSMKFAQEFGRFFTEDQFKLSNMEDRQAIAAIDAASQWAKALRPDFLQFMSDFEGAVTRDLIQGAEALRDLIRRVGAGALAVVQLPFDMAKWVKENLSTILWVAGGTAVLVIGAVLYTTLSAPSRALSGREAA